MSLNNMYSRRICYTLMIVVTLVATAISRGGSAPLVGRQNNALASGASRSLAALPLQTAGATITVNDKGDSTANDGKCTLREAIIAANTNIASGTAMGECAAGTSGNDRIDFSLGTQGSATINPTSALPTITEPVMIRGNSGGLTNVEINGSAAGASATGLSISAGNTIIQRLVINNFGGAGIYITGNGSNIIRGCFIGTNPGGMAKNGNGNGAGIEINGSSNNLVGGTESGARNIISGNIGAGILIAVGDSGIPAASGNQVFGNFVGTDFVGRGTLGNGGAGISIVGAKNNTIGGDTPEKRNIISGNNGDGILIANGASGISVIGNFIGPDISGTERLNYGFGDGNSGYGVHIAGSSNNYIGGIRKQLELSIDEGNVIKYNTKAAIFIENTSTTWQVDGTNNSKDNVILGNQIHRNIELFNGANDKIKSPKILSVNTIDDNGIKKEEIYLEMIGEQDANYRIDLFLQGEPIFAVTVKIDKKRSYFCPTPQECLYEWFGQVKFFPQTTIGGYSINYSIRPASCLSATATRLDSNGSPVVTSAFSECFIRPLSGCEKRETGISIVTPGNMTFSAASSKTEFYIAAQFEYVKKEEGEDDKIIRCPCNNVKSSVDWITFDNEGTRNLELCGSSTLPVYIHQNPGGPRIGKLTIGDNEYTITQMSECSLTAYPSNLFFSSAGGEQAANVFTGLNCIWEALLPNTTWARLSGSVRGTGSSLIDLVVDPNSKSVGRNTSLNIKTQTVNTSNVFIKQDPPCTLSVNPEIVNFDYAAGSGSLKVTSPSGCAWNVESLFPGSDGTVSPWITLTSPSTGSGDAEINYTVSENKETVERRGIISVFLGADISNRKGLVINQSPGCAVSFEGSTEGVSGPITELEVPPYPLFGDPTGALFRFITIKVDSACQWVATTNASWIHIENENGSGNSSLRLRIDSNRLGKKRRKGIIKVNQSTLTIYQDKAQPCKYNLDPDSKQFAVKGGSGSVTVDVPADCKWVASVGTSWIRLTGNSKGQGSGTINYTVDTNGSGANRSNAIKVLEDNEDGEESLNTPSSLSILQDGGCTYQVSPTSQSLPSVSGKENVTVDTPSGCEWDSYTSDSWITFTGSSPSQRISVINPGRPRGGGSPEGKSGASLSGKGTMTYFFAENKGPARTGSLSVAGTTVEVTQAAGSTIAILEAVIPRGKIGENYSLQFTQTGAPGLVSWTVSRGRLPNGLALSNSGLLSGTPTNPGSFDIVIRVTDSSGYFGESQYKLQIDCQALIITPASLPAAANGVAFDQALGLSGGNGEIKWEISFGTLPKGITLVTQPTVRIAGTPTQSGTFPFKVRATIVSTGCSAEWDFFLSVDCPVVIGPEALNGNVGVPFIQAFTQTGISGNVSWEVRNGSLPPGLELNKTTGLLSGTPTQSGRYFFSIRAASPSATQSCYGQISCALQIGCQSLSITPGSLPQAITGMMFDQPLVLNGGSGPTNWVISSGELPPGLQIDSGTGRISGVPTVAGTFNFAIRALIISTRCVVEQQFSLIITCATISIVSMTVNEGRVGVPFRQQLLQSGGSGSISWQVVSGSLPNNISLTSNGLLVGTPSALGASTFSVRVTDSYGCSGVRSLTMTISICPTITVTPGALSDGRIGSDYLQTLTAAGGAGGYLFTSSGEIPRGLTLSPNGILSGRPTVVGVYNFTIIATDLTGCAGSTTYSLTICPDIALSPNTLPAGSVGKAYSQTLSSGTGNFQTIFSFTGTLPPGVTLSNSGILSGTPTQTGSFSFTVTASGAYSCSASRAYTIDIGQSGLLYYALSRPLRLLDTRQGQRGCDAPGQQLQSGTARTQTVAGRTCDGISIPAGARALTGTVTTYQSGGGTLKIYPGDAATPNIANLVYDANQVTGNAFTVGLDSGDGAFKVLASSNTHVGIDITGYYAPPGSGGLYFHPLTRPIRLLDTRVGQSACYTPRTKITAGGERTQRGRGLCSGVTIPTGTSALVGIVTTYGPDAQGTLTIYPGVVTPRPATTSAAYASGQSLSAPFVVGLATDGTFKIYSSAASDISIDVVGYYSQYSTDLNGPGQSFLPLSRPVRLLETRSGEAGCNTPGSPLAANTTRVQTVFGACDGVTIPSNALSVVLNATLINPAADGLITFWPAAASPPAIGTSNYQAGKSIARQVTVGLGSDGGFRLTTTTATDLSIDIFGFFIP